MRDAASRHRRRGPQRPCAGARAALREDGRPHGLRLAIAPAPVTSSRWKIPGRSVGTALTLVLALLLGAGGASTASAVDAELAQRLETACPCAGPARGGSWGSPNPYQACVRRELRAAVQQGAITEAKARRARRAAVRSSCGLRSSRPANVEVCGPGVTLSCETVRTAHVDDCAECDAALAGELVECARYADSAGAETVECGERLPAVRGASRVVERRTGVDCGSCTTKLGTERPEGVTCLRAACGAL
jgi:hypothetical protein